MLELKNISVSFGEKTVLSGCTLSLAPGEKLALMGSSGCGKTTLLRTALGLQPPDSGGLINTFSRPAAVFQEDRMFPWLTALENVNLVLSGKAKTLPDALRWLEQLKLDEAADLYPSELSGGMRQRVSIARALCVRPELLILDEPLKQLDHTLKQRVAELIAEACRGCAILLATHSEEEAAALGCRVLRYRDGSFWSDGE